MRACFLGGSPFRVETKHAGLIACFVGVWVGGWVGVLVGLILPSRPEYQQGGAAGSGSGLAEGRRRALAEGPAGEKGAHTEGGNGGS